MLTAFPEFVSVITVEMWISSVSYESKSSLPLSISMLPVLPAFIYF